ncbi:MAG TPA: nitrogen fixation protein [Methylococcales bacterium]
MKRSTDINSFPYCPSAQPDIAGSIVFGVVGGTAQAPQLMHIEPRPVTSEVLALTQPVNPAEVFRFAAPCAGDTCQHFDGFNCRLATRIVASLPVVVDSLPSCHLRPTCRWWQQEGKTACFRCPQIVTETHNPTEHLQNVADSTL